MVLEYGILDLVGFSKISNDELDNLIRDYRNKHGLACGRSIKSGHLNSLGINLKRKDLFVSILTIVTCDGR